MNLKKIKDSLLWSSNITVGNVNDFANLCNRLNLDEEQSSILEDAFQDYSVGDKLFVEISTTPKQGENSIEINDLYLTILS